MTVRNHGCRHCGRYFATRQALHDHDRVKHKPEKKMTANEALELAETMSGGEAAQMALAAELMGLDYEDFIDELIAEDQEP